MVTNKKARMKSFLGKKSPPKPKETFAFGPFKGVPVEIWLELFSYLTKVFGCDLKTNT